MKGHSRVSVDLLWGESEVNPPVWPGDYTPSHVQTPGISTYIFIYLFI